MFMYLKTSIRGTMSIFTELTKLQNVLAVLILDAARVYGKECYNYKEEPRVRSCDHCCGDDYEEYCCDATLQIVGSVIGGCLVLGAIIGLAYFCYRNKTKRRLVHAPAALGRLGMRSHNNATSNQARQPNRRPPRIPVNRHSQINATYDNAYVNSVHMQPPGYYPPAYTNNVHSVPFAPTAPMPPPYEMTAPPPYAISKSVPPPPEYNSVVNHMATPGHKPGEYNDTMPPPAE